MRGPALASFFLALAGCYGPGVMGWGMNDTHFEVAKDEGFVQVTKVGKGPMKAVPSESPAEYHDDPPSWDDFALQFERAGTRISQNAPATRGSDELPAGQPWSLNRTAGGPIQLGDRLYFCHRTADAAPYRFAAIMSPGGPADYNLWFEALPRCP